jgi:hypothetical protein
LDNPDHCKLKKLEFEGVNLGDRGLLRIIDAANKTPSLHELDVGVLTSSSLMLLAERLHGNQHLDELSFSETDDHQQFWTKEACDALCNLLRTSTCITKIKAKFQACNSESELAASFADEIGFYTDQKKKLQVKEKDFKKRMLSCD